MGRSSMRFCSANLCFFLSLGGSSGAVEEGNVFVDGGKLVGGTNGIIFDAANNLHACQSLGRCITKLDPETGEFLDHLGRDEGVLVPDDAVFTVDGTVYWSEFILGTFMKRPPGGPTEMLYPPFTYPNANPLALSDDGTRLFFAQCFNEFSPNGVYQRDLTTGVTTALVEGIPSCSSNSMDFKDEALYTPRLYEGRIVKIDLANNNTVSDVSTGLGIPNAVKFNSQGVLYGTDSQFGRVYRYDIDNADTESNRELVFEAPFNSIDNLIIDQDDRLYISSVNRGTILEVLLGPTPDSESTQNYRTVVPGILTIPCGVAVLDDVVYTVNPNGVAGYDTETGEEVLFYEPVIGVGDLESPLTVVAWPQKGLLLIMSLLNNILLLWDPATQSAQQVVELNAQASDAHPFLGDQVIVAQANGDIVLLSGANYENRQVIANIPGASFLAGDDSNVYASNFVAGNVVQIIMYGSILDVPEVVSTGHETPEGIALTTDNNGLVLVAAGSGQLEHIDLESGEVTVIATGLDFQPPLPEITPFGFPNDVALYDNYAFVNGDGANVLYKIELPKGDEEKEPPTLGPTSEPTSSWGIRVMVAPALITTFALMEFVQLIWILIY